jgi:iron complex outermembrane recepter protein
MSFRVRPLGALLFIPSWTLAGGDDRLDEVVVTATALHESALEVAQPTSVLAGDDLVRDRGTSIGEALAGTAGVSATYFGPQASRPVIRGQSGERVQVSEDGAESLDVAALSADHAVTIDPLLAERVEVLRGPATLLYGNGAAGGLVNVLVRRVPESARQGIDGAVELRGDRALGERALALRIDGGSDHWVAHGDAYARDTEDVDVASYAWSPRLRASGELSQEDLAASRGRIPNSDSRLRGGALGISRVGERGFAGFAISTFDTRYGIPGPEAGVSIDLQQTRLDFNSDWHDPARGIGSAHLRASYNRYEHAELEPGGEVGTRFDQDGLSLRLAVDTESLAGWRGSFGVQYRELDFRATGEEAFVPASRTRNLGLFAYEERAFGALTLELGGRLEHQEIGSAEIPAGYESARASFAAGLVWKLPDGWSTALNATSTQRHPTSTELFAFGPHVAVQRFEIGDPTLRPERATTLDLSLRHEAERWSMSLTGFRSHYDGYLFPELTGAVEDGLPVAQYRQADARFTGVELELELPKVALPGAELATRFVADTVRAQFTRGGPLPQIPPRRLAMEWRYLRPSWSAGISAHRFGSQDRIAEHELPTSGFTLLSADLTWRTQRASGAPTWLLYLRGSNLLDEDARRHASPLKEFAPLPGRSVGAGVRLEF